MDTNFNNPSEGEMVLFGLPGLLICNALSNNDLRSLSECSFRTKALSLGTVRSLQPKNVVGLSQRFPSLRMLDLSKDQCKWNLKGSYSELIGLKYLTHLQLNRCLSLTNSDLSELVCICTSITALDLRGCSKLTWPGLGCLVSLQNLTELNCSGIKYNEASGLHTTPQTASASSLPSMLSKLQKLVMGDACTLSWVDDGLMNIVGAHGISLTEVDCSGCIDISNAGVSALKPLANTLHCLSLQSCVRITNESLSSLACLTKMKDLNLRGCLQVSSSGVRQLSSLVMMERLDFTGCTAIEALDEMLFKCMPELKSLSVAGCALTNLSQLSFISKSLQHLSISNCSKLTMESLVDLSSLIELVTLDMSNIQMGSQAADVSTATNQGLSLLSRLSKLQNLNMSRFIHPKGLPSGLLAGIAGMTTLRMLNLANSSLPGAASDAVLAAVQCALHSRTGSTNSGTDAASLEPRNKLLRSQDMTHVADVPLINPGLSSEVPLSSYQLWFLQDLTQLSHLNLSGWRKASPSWLLSLSQLTSLRELRLQRFGNDNNETFASAPPSSAPVHICVNAIRCPRSSMDSDNSDSSPSPTCSDADEPNVRAALSTSVLVRELGRGLEDLDIQAQVRGYGASSLSAVAQAPRQEPQQACCCPHWPRCFCPERRPAADANGKFCSLVHSSEKQQVDSFEVRHQSMRRSFGQQLGAKAAFPVKKSLTSYLRGLAQLEVLDLEACTTIDEACIIPLSFLGNLRQLNLAGCVKLNGSSMHCLAAREGGVTATCSTENVQLGTAGLPSEMRDAQMEQLQASPGSKEQLQNLGSDPDSLAVATGYGCPALHVLSLDDCPQIGTDELAGIAAINSLQHLSLRGCSNVKDHGLVNMAHGLKQLRSLSLFSATGVTSRGLSHLSSLPHLKTLNLSHCWNVDDEGLQLLAGCRSLATLGLQHCWRLSETAIQAIQSSNPALEIMYC
ncbi:hypothetical protein CEUSTIGMA_g2279.t1 [Chlamydomonas eustigma]|uniref:F-box/LRR-repeat protein 15-like leucin rich repeat domain-containing protein n=1 Tax=Chlamydomonas eustigma TaxID=1157962 RepID=A0A250WVG1_9CHLO|nr:hypothetical protein CEUSTIGMA_g2279.t1 [Chlamydomonas eustigma]|eukprot:GAX74833.1 hypothetical protein CEUSTIGMA_g2279.t1 [Chlamydomonas eustigma]